MAEKAVWGEDVSLQMLIDGTYRTIMCATDCTYTCNVEFIEKTGPESGGSREWMRRLEEHISTITGVTRITNESTLTTFFYMLQTGIRREPQNFKMIFTNDNGDAFYIMGEGLIGTQGINGPAADWSQGTIEIRWNGAPSMTEIAMPSDGVIQDPLYISMTDGQEWVTHADLTQAGINILHVERNGVGHDKTTGTPGNRQYMWDDSTDRIYFDAANPGITGEVVYVLFEIA